LSNISDLIFYGLCIIDHIRGEHLIDLEFFIDKFLEFLSVSDFIDELSNLNDLFFEIRYKLAKGLNAIFF
jgi:hypothetical protein